MKITLLLCLILFGKLAFCADSSVAGTDKKNNTIENVTSNNQLNALLKVNGVKGIYDKCQTDYKNDENGLEKIPKCIWEEVQKDETLKKAVQAEYQKMNKTSDENAKVDLSNNQSNMNSTFSAEQNKGYKALSDIIGKKLKEVLYGKDLNPENVNSVDHALFHNIYEKEISKNIVDMTTTFCMSVDLSTKPSANSECVTNKSNELNCQSIKDPNANSECLKKATGSCLEFTYDESNKETNKTKNIKLMEELSLDHSIVNMCILSIPNLCRKTAGDVSKVSQDACVVSDAIKAARKNLLLNDKLKKIYEELPTETANIYKNINPNNVTNEKIANAITVTSKEIDDSYKKADEELKKKAEACVDNPNDPSCEMFLSKNKNDKEQALAEFGLRQFAKEEEFKAALDSKDKNILKDYLIKIGYDKDKAEELTKDDNKIAEIKNSITERFKAEKEALIKELSDRIKKTTTTDDGKTSDNDKSKYLRIAEELNAKTDNLKNLVRFNNITSSYLETGDKNNRDPSSTEPKTKRNTASATLELNADKDNKNNANLQKDISSVKSKSDGSSFLEIKTINEILGLGI